MLGRRTCKLEAAPAANEAARNAVSDAFVVTEVSGAAARPLRLDELLLDAKLSVPGTRPGFGEPRRAHRDGAASDCRVVGVTAPAGYGKSTLLAQWARAEDRRVAWVSLDRFDDDPGGAARRCWRPRTRGSRPATPTWSPTWAVSACRRWAARRRGWPSAFRTSPAPFVLMLDDLHELRSPACHDVLSVVISGIPPGSQLVAASRSEQPHLPRLRAAGRRAGVRARATWPSTRPGPSRSSPQAQRRPSRRELAAAVTERTEGWPVGLYLAALIAGRQPTATR